MVLLGVTVITALGTRWLLPGLPLQGATVTLTLAEVVLVLVGLAILGFHCSAMFFTSLVEWLPGTQGAVHDIRLLGTASLIWYTAPALMVTLGLRRLPWYGIGTVVLALLAIGITMYDGGTLHIHLTAIFIAVLCISAASAALVSPP